MAWQVIGISNPAQLNLKDRQLVIKQDETVSLPIEDIDALILDSYGITTTANLITELSSNGTTVVVCDEKHLPASVILPYSQHSRQAKVSRQQLAMSQPLRKQLWQKIIVQKITNQATVLQQFDYDATPLKDMAKIIKSGDSDNRESQAARLYFSLLLDDSTRRKPMWHNSALNYGYAMVRSHIARHIASRGLVASQGIFHRSELNSFNLADDIIEPFRPVVDEYVLSHVALFHIGETDASLTKEDRCKIVDILNYSVTIDNRKYPIKFAIERTIESFIQAIESGEGSNLLLPSVVSK
ncbi:type II CRISPR-associated endonuclease Cas1 [Candidatus Saccharibacteria bacterium]|nr:type II CRISPR-associated endonuclease Cas1 [Candidatus Saccharibacteria bacterium]